MTSKILKNRYKLSASEIEELPKYISVENFMTDNFVPDNLERFFEYPRSDKFEPFLAFFKTCSRFFKVEIVLVNGKKLHSRSFLVGKPKQKKNLGRLSVRIPEKVSFNYSKNRQK